MPFSTLAANQMVSEQEAASSGFALNPSKSHGSGNMMMTKVLALDRYNLKVASMNSYASNQLVPKSAWETAVVSYFVPISFSQFATAAEACAVVGTTAMGGLYKANTNPVTNGTVFYQDANLTTVFPGINYFQVIEGVIGRLSNVGVVSEYQSCSVSDTTPPTPPTYVQADGGVTTGNIDIFWNGDTDNVAVTLYHIYRNGTFVGTNTVRNYADYNLPGGASYYYHVYALDAAGNISSISPQSNTININPGINPV